MIRRTRIGRMAPKKSNLNSHSCLAIVQNTHNLLCSVVNNCQFFLCHGSSYKIHDLLKCIDQRSRTQRTKRTKCKTGFFFSRILWYLYKFNNNNHLRVGWSSKITITSTWLEVENKKVQIHNLASNDDSTGLVVCNKKSNSYRKTIYSGQKRRRNRREVVNGLLIC